MSVTPPLETIVIDRLRALVRERRQAAGTAHQANRLGQKSYLAVIADLDGVDRWLDREAKWRSNWRDEGPLPRPEPQPEHPQIPEWTRAGE